MIDLTQRTTKMLVLLITAISFKAHSETVLKKILPPKTNVASSSLQSYLDRVRADNSSLQPASGSIWTDSGRLTRMTTDVRAMRPHDLISVVVSESLAASTDGEVKTRAHPMPALRSPLSSACCTPVTRCRIWSIKPPPLG